MTEPLIVDPSRLKDAGTALRNQNFPELPLPFAATGADSISAAIDETLPIIESPVIQGLPAIKAALNRTSASIVIAANLYADTDQRLGEHVNKVQFLGAAQRSPRSVGAAALATGSAADPSADGETVGAPTPAPPLTPPPVTEAVPQLGELTGTVGTLGTVTSSATQGAQSATGSTPATGPTSPQPADESGKHGEEEQHPEKHAEGALSGDQASESVPGQPPAIRPQTAASGRVLESGAQ